MEEKQMEKAKKDQIVACLQCNKSHKRCDGKRPCTHCLETGKECTDNPERKARGRPKKRDVEAAVEVKKRKDTQKIQKINEKQDISMRVQKLPQPFGKTTNLTIDTITTLSFGNSSSSPKFLVGNSNLGNGKDQFTFTPTKDSNRCTSCNSVQSEDSIFCNKCGEKISQNKLFSLQNQIGMLRSRNEQLKRLVEMKEFTKRPNYVPPAMWALFKYQTAPTHKMCPPPVYILKASPALGKLLGYDSLLNAYLPDLVPKEYHKIIGEDSFPSLPGEQDILPQISCNSKVVYKHKEGHFIDAQVNITIYYDPVSRSPSFGMLLIHNVWPHESSSADLPVPILPLESKYAQNYWDPPPHVKMLDTLPQANLLHTPPQANLLDTPPSPNDPLFSSTPSPSFPSLLPLTISPDFDSPSASSAPSSSSFISPSLLTDTKFSNVSNESDSDNLLNTSSSFLNPTSSFIDTAEILSEWNDLFESKQVKKDNEEDISFGSLYNNNKQLPSLSDPLSVDLFTDDLSFQNDFVFGPDN